MVLIELIQNMKFLRKVLYQEIMKILMTLYSVNKIALYSVNNIAIFLIKVLMENNY